MSLIAWKTDDAHYAVPVDLTIHSLPAVIRAAYKLSDRVFAFLQRDEVTPDKRVWVFLFGRSPKTDLSAVVGELTNELIDQQLRVQLEAEFKHVRTLIVAQAFAEGNLLDQSDDRTDYRTDPHEASKRR